MRCKPGKPRFKEKEKLDMWTDPVLESEDSNSLSHADKFKLSRSQHMVVFEFIFCLRNPNN